jgi:hypothetical protein
MNVLELQVLVAISGIPEGQARPAALAASPAPGTHPPPPPTAKFADVPARLLSR